MYHAECDMASKIAAGEIAIAENFMAMLHVPDFHKPDGVAFFGGAQQTMPKHVLEKTEVWLRLLQYILGIACLPPLLHMKATAPVSIITTTPATFPFLP